MRNDEWLVVKRDLYYMPNDCGYTGIRDHAGRYSHAEACSRLGEGISIVHLNDAPEFSKACFDDLARDHLIKQRDRLVEALTPSGHTKAAYIGEFVFNRSILINGEEHNERVTVPWTTVKEIMAAIRKRAGVTAT